MLLTLVSFSSLANDPLDSIFKKQQEFLPVDDAFQFSYHQNGDKVELNWVIADGYYMYADKFQFSVNGAELGQVEKPEATQIEDEFFGITDVYFFGADLDVNLSNIQDGSVLSVRYQGCAKALAALGARRRCRWRAATSSGQIVRSSSLAGVADRIDAAATTWIVRGVR